MHSDGSVSRHDQDQMELRGVLPAGQRWSQHLVDDDDLILVNSRHSSALDEIRGCLGSATDKFESDEAIELIASDLRGALEAIGTILGKIDNEDMLDVLFSTFCIGK